MHSLDKLEFQILLCKLANVENIMGKAYTEKGETEDKKWFKTIQNSNIYQNIPRTNFPHRKCKCKHFAKNISYGFHSFDSMEMSENAFDR